VSQESATSGRSRWTWGRIAATYALSMLAMVILGCVWMPLLEAFMVAGCVGFVAVLLIVVARLMGWRPGGSQEADGGGGGQGCRRL